MPVRPLGVADGGYGGAGLGLHRPDHPRHTYDGDSPPEIVARSLLQKWGGQAGLTLPSSGQRRAADGLPDLAYVADRWGAELPEILAAEL